MGHSSRILSQRGFRLAVCKLSDHYRCSVPAWLVYLLGVASRSSWEIVGEAKASPTSPFVRRCWGTMTFQQARSKLAGIPGDGKQQGHHLCDEACGVSWKPPATQMSPDFPYLLERRRKRKEVTPGTQCDPYPSLRPPWSRSSGWDCHKQSELKGGSWGAEISGSVEQGAGSWGWERHFGSTEVTHASPHSALAGLVHPLEPSLPRAHDCLWGLLPASCLDLCSIP